MSHPRNIKEYVLNSVIVVIEDKNAEIAKLKDTITQMQNKINRAYCSVCDRIVNTTDCVHCHKCHQSAHNNCANYLYGRYICFNHIIEI